MINAFLNKRAKLKFFLSLLIGMLCPFFTCLISQNSLFHQIENSSWDWRLRLTADVQKIDPQIKLILIDQSSLDFLAKQEGITWPWPREVYANLIFFLKEAGARGIAFDMLYTEDSFWGVEDDQKFASAISSKMPVINSVVLGNEKRSIDQDRLLAYKTVLSDTPGDKVCENDYQNIFGSKFRSSKYSSVIFPILPIIQASTALGNTGAIPDDDGVFRHVSPGGSIQGLQFFNLAFALYHAVSDNFCNLDLTNFLTQDRQLTVNFHGKAGTYQSYKASAILLSNLALFKGDVPSVDPKQFKDAWVFIGASAPGLLDSRTTPLDRIYSGVEFHATVLDNLLHNDFIKNASFMVNLSITFLVATLAAFSCLFTKKLTATIFFVLAILGGIFLYGYLTAAAGYWVLLLLPTTACILSIITSLALQYQLEGKEHRFLKNAFSYYVSPTVIDQMVSNPSKLTLGGDRREITAFFSDIEGFTKISEQLDPVELVSLLNVYLSEMTEVVLSSDGTLDKYVGDAIVCFWNAPLSSPEHADKAVKVALRCQDKLKKIAPQLRQRYQVDIKMRIGINSGLAVVGNIGSRERFDYTAIGDVVNLASRLEGANKFFGTSILISDDTKRLLTDQCFCRRLGIIQVVGKNQGINIWEPFIDHYLSPERLLLFERAIQDFEEGNVEQALNKFIQIAEDDPVSRAYVERIKREIQIPKNEWSPIWSLQAK